MRNTMRLLFIGFALLAATGCVEEGLFMACPFDQAIEENCISSETGVALTCIVKKHPQCAEDVCLRWESAEQATCTRRCEGATDCPVGSQCTPFQDSLTTDNPDGANCSNSDCYCVQDVDLAL